ncbi:MAG TPA: hypothetical protein VHK69_09230, partial [Chitinophagaceae bacterium]|nr:hypothetical protein [Chitinophagaceae bacterium]
MTFSFFSEAVRHALLWMLVHSLWQALVAAVLAGLLILATRTKPAAFRYNGLLLIGLLFVLAAAGTFYGQFTGYRPSAPGNSHPVVLAAEGEGLSSELPESTAG